MTDEELTALVAKAIKEIEAGDQVAASATILTIPPSQRVYVMESLRGAIADKRAKLSREV